MNVKTKSCSDCSQEEIEKDCISNGLYCPIAPLATGSRDEKMLSFIHKLDGRSLIKQSLPSKCVHMILYEYSNDLSHSLSKSLDYMLYFRANCTMHFDSSKIDSFDCAQDQMR